MALGVQAKIRIDRDRQRNEVSVFAEPALKCRALLNVSRLVSLQARCVAERKGIVLKLCQCLSRSEISKGVL